MYLSPIARSLYVLIPDGISTFRLLGYASMYLSPPGRSPVARLFSICVLVYTEYSKSLAVLSLAVLRVHKYTYFWQAALLLAKKKKVLPPKNNWMLVP